MLDTHTSTKENVIINSVDRSLDVLEYLFKVDKEVSISQISKDLDVYKSTIFRTLATLESRGYVFQNKTNELYSLGPKIFAYNSRKKTNIFSVSIEPFLQRLSSEFLELVTSAILTKDKNGVYALSNIASIKSRLALTVNFEGSSASECYCSSMGKCLLAFSDNIDLSIYNEFKPVKFTENTITDYKDLAEELKQVRKQGYAIDNEEREIGLFCLGVPIISGGKAVAAMSLSGPAARIRDNELEEKIQYMKELSAEISSTLLL